MTATPRGLAYVVDTSVALKWFLIRDEPHHQQARQLREAYLKGQCILRAPELLAFELANVLKSGKRLTSPEVIEAVHQLRELDLQLEAFRWTTLAKAVEIASACDTTVYDSYFLAMALESDSILVTADEVFLRKTRRYPGIVSLRQLRLAD